MSDQARWSEDRFGDRQRQENNRTRGYGADESYGRDSGQERYAERRFGDNGYPDGPYAGGQRYGQYSSGRGGFEDRSFSPSDRNYDSYGVQSDRGRRPPGPPSGDRDFDTRRGGGALMEPGYRAPFGGVHGDAQGYSSQGYSSADAGRYRYGGDRSEFGRADSGARADLGRIDYGPDGHAYRAQDNGGRGWWDQTRDEVSAWFGDDQAAQRRRADDMRHGVHRGHGPKGYARSDDRIREDVNDRLTDDHFLDASDIEVKVAQGEVTLGGHVRSRHDKRRAEDIAEQILGAKHVQNNLRIQDAQTQAGALASGAALGSVSGAAAQTGTTKSN